MSVALDSALRDRVRAVLEHGPATETELRRVTEDASASVMLARADVERSERRLDELANEPTASFADLASALRTVQELRPALAELESMLDELTRRAGEFRRSWLARDRVDSLLDR